MNRSLNVVGTMTNEEFKSKIDWNMIIHVLITIQAGTPEDKIQEIIQEGKELGVHSIYLKKLNTIVQFICSEEDFQTIRLKHMMQSEQEIYDFYAKKEHYTVGK